MAEHNFLLGRGERLTEPVVAPGRPVTRIPPYTFEQARDRVLPMVRQVTRRIDSLPAAACPHDEVVGGLILNPEYIAKSYFPDHLLRAAGFRLVGSRARRIKPERRSAGREPVETITTELFVAGTRRAYHDWLSNIARWSPDTRASQELPAIEKFVAPSAEEKIKSIENDARDHALEIVLHASEFKQDAYVLEAFEAFVEGQGLIIDMDRRVHVGGLCFLGLETPRNKIEDIAEFSFLRIAREMPRLRVLRPMLRSAQPTQGKVVLPNEPALDRNIRVAVFDGGVPEKAVLSRWVKCVDSPSVGRTEPDFLRHGHAVTSALLFGPLDPQQPASRPFANVDHYRVLDTDSGNDPFELLDVLERIRAVLSTNTYDFINVSIGPADSIDEGEISPWTALFDEHLADGKTLAAIAVGNNGDHDRALGYNRIQIPSDCVNGLAVGAVDSNSSKWKRAPYSAVGPGRSPGIVKPDVVAFGGCAKEPFLVLDGGSVTSPVPIWGTSFASPHVLRTAIALRAHFGQLLSPLAIKALLINCAERRSHPQAEVGWGKVPDSIEELVTCPDSVVRVVYQGELTASKYLRAPLPLPTGSLQGNVLITATFCFATAVDPAHPSNYTRGGLEVFFRPNRDIHEPGSMHAKTAGFFRAAALYQTEDQLRRDAHKWETCLHASLVKRGASLKEPIFDIHYQARIQGQNDRSPNKIPYALVVTVESPRTKDLYDRVVRRYRTILEPLTPIIQIPIRTSAKL